MMIFARKKLTYLVCIALLVSCAPAPPEPKVQTDALEATNQTNSHSSRPANVASRVASVIQEHELAARAYEQARHGGPKEQKSSAFPSAPCAIKLLAIIEENPEDPEIVRAINWILANARNDEQHRCVIEFLNNDFFESEHIAEVLPVLIHGYPDQSSLNLVQRLSQHSPHERVKAVATMASVMAHQTMVRFVRFLNKPKWTERMKSFIDATTLRHYQTAVDRKFDFESTLQQLIDQSGEFTFGPSVEGQPSETIHEMASDMLFSIQHLKVGKPAPNITGTDLDGVAFSLDDYRGKIVMLDFWGDW